MQEIQTKRIYGAPTKSDGYRVLVDRLWPRGLTKEKAAIDLWAKDIAPSDALRKWFHHHLEEWTEFEKKYQKELIQNASLSQFIDTIKAQKKVTFLFSSKETEQNNATVLKAFLDKR